jgi:hypothetical protein
MTDIEQKALALLNEVRREYPNAADYTSSHIALCRAIEQHEAFKQEVSDAIAFALKVYAGHSGALDPLERFIIPKPKPDPLVEIMEGLDGEWTPDEYAKAIRAALEARGLEIREKNDD